MSPVHLERFLEVARTLHFPRAAEALGIPLPSLYTSIQKLEAEVGHPLFTTTKPTALTSAGAALLQDTPRLIAEAPARAEPPRVPAGGKAKASKGKGRAPIVKGQPKPYKKRQGR